MWISLGPDPGPPHFFFMTNLGPIQGPPPCDTCFQYASRKHTYIILTPLNPTFI